MNIKIIGSNCSNGIKLKKNLLKALNETVIDASVELKDDGISQKKYNINNIPALIINGKTCSQGKVLAPREITKFIKSFAAN